MHINGALFRDTQGFALKPDSLLGGPKRGGNATLKLTVVGGENSGWLVLLYTLLTLNFFF